jgi:hypothetical protein
MANLARESPNVDFPLGRLSKRRQDRVADGWHEPSVTERGYRINRGDRSAAWIDAAVEDGGAVRAPAVDNDHSGRFLLRVPKDIRRWLVAQARREDVSLNTPCGDDARGFTLGNGSGYAIASGIKT